MQVLVPWRNTSVSVGVDGENSLRLAKKLSARLVLGEALAVQLEVEPDNSSDSVSCELYIFTC